MGERLRVAGHQGVCPAKPRPVPRRQLTLTNTLWRSTATPVDDAGGPFDLFGCGPGPTICPHRSSWLAVGPERRQVCGAHRKHGDDRDAHWRAADVPAAFRLGRRNLARMFLTMMTVITAATSEAARSSRRFKPATKVHSIMDHFWTVEKAPRIYRFPTELPGRPAA